METLKESPASKFPTLKEKGLKTPEQKVRDALSRYHSRLLMISTLKEAKKDLQKRIALLQKYQRKERAIIKTKGVTSK